MSDKVFFLFGSHFSGWVEFWIKKSCSVPDRELLLAINYGPYPSVTLVRIRSIFFLKLVESDWSSETESTSSCITE